MVAKSLDLSSMQELDVEKMKQEREARSLSQADAAKKAKMTVSRWCDIETGGRNNVTMETLSIIAEALGCDARDLITPPDKKKRKG